MVMGSGQRLRCDGVVRQVPLSIRGCGLLCDLYFLSLDSAYIVLGVSWLSSLWQIIQDYSRCLFEFSLKGQKYSMIGEPLDKAQLVQLHTLRRLCETNKMSSYFCLQVVATKDSDPHPSPSELDPILSSYADMFCKPQGLPPARKLDHAINLNPGSRQVNVKPYRHP